MSPLQDHPNRYALANELHARPFPSLRAPCQAAYLAIKQPREAANRDRAADRAHLLDLLDRYGTSHPAPEDTHFFGQIGRYHLKWESHTEFVTYTIFGNIPEGPAFDASGFNVFPEDWLENAPGARITSCLIRVEERTDEETDISKQFDTWFVPESLAASSVLDESAVIATDFRIDTSGHMRMAAFVSPDTGMRRIGRVIQRLCEIETYKSMAMLCLPKARRLGAQLGDMDQTLSKLVEDMRNPDAQSVDTLDGLLEIASELETMLARSAFRFGARGAYEALVNQRIAVLREERYGGRQTFAEFMMRRFDPAMRTCVSVERRMETMAERARRAGDLLGTRVNVERSEQNQKLLESMDERAALQLRLQKTVEGLSVVAISYYALNLVGYMLYPVASPFGLSKEWVFGLAVVPVVILVWMMVARIRKSMES